MKSNSIKMYDKYSCLRVEMTINDPGEFKVNKEVHHKDGITSKQWVPMGKSIANFYRYAEISKAANKRFLDSMKNIVPQKSLEKEISAVCGKKTVKGKTFTGFHVWEKETFRLFETISDGSYLIRGFTNQDIRKVLGRRESEPVKERNRISRELRKLRAHGLIRKIPHTRRYLVTDKGHRVIGALIETRKRIYPGLAAG